MQAFVHENNVSQYGKAVFTPTNLHKLLLIGTKCFVFRAQFFK